MSQILQLGLAILSAIALGGICLLLPDKVSGFIAADLVAPVFDTFMGLLSAIAGPIIFLSVVWGICGIGGTVLAKRPRAPHSCSQRRGKRLYGKAIYDGRMLGTGTFIDATQ